MSKFNKQKFLPMKNAATLQMEHNFTQKRSKVTDSLPKNELVHLNK